MIVIDLLNRTELLTDCNDISIERTLGGEHTIQCTVHRTENNAHAYNLLQDDSLIISSDETFVVKDIDETPFSKNIIAINSFFECIDDYVEELWPDGLYTIQESLQLAFSTSDWTYLIDGDYPQRAKLEGFGNDNPVSMLNKILSAFNSEYEIDTPNKRVIVKRRLGVDTDYQIRDRHNITDISRKIDSMNVKTAVKVFYNLDEFGNYNSSVIYYSPNRSKYRKTKWHKPIYSDVITSEAQAISTARLILKDIPDITFSVEFTTLQDMGYNSDKVQLGNGVFLIDERLGIESTARIVAVREFYKQVNGQLVKDINRSPMVTISNIQKTVSRALVQQQQQQAQIEQTAVKQQVIYNGCTISKEDGFKATALNGVETTLNASEGISIKRNGDFKFFVDANNDELTMDGRLTVKDNGVIISEVFKDTAGGINKIYDKDGLLNVSIGSNKFDGQRTGGSLKLYNDGSADTDSRVEIDIYRESDSGQISLFSGGHKLNVILEAKNFVDNEAALTMLTDNAFTYGQFKPTKVTLASVGATTTMTANEIVIVDRPVKQNIEELWEAIEDIYDRLDDL